MSITSSCPLRVARICVSLTHVCVSLCVCVFVCLCAWSKGYTALDFARAFKHGAALSRLREHVKANPPPLKQVCERRFNPTRSFLHIFLLKQVCQKAQEAALQSH